MAGYFDPASNQSHKGWVIKIAKVALGNKTATFGISCKCNFFKRNHWTIEENKDENQWFMRKYPVLMAAWL